MFCLVSPVSLETCKQLFEFLFIVPYFPLNGDTAVGNVKVCSKVEYVSCVHNLSINLLYSVDP